MKIELAVMRSKRKSGSHIDQVIPVHCMRKTHFATSKEMTYTNTEVDNQKKSHCIYNKYTYINERKFNAGTQHMYTYVYFFACLRTH